MKKVIQAFYAELVAILPFKDAHFRASLQSAELFYGDLKEKVEAKDTSAEMASYFLDHGINNNADSFLKLLTVMEEFDSDTVKELARKIRQHLSNEPGTSYNSCVAKL